MRERILAAIVLLTLVLSGTAACGTDVDEAPGVALPEGFPADVPVYRGTIVDSDQSATGNGTGYTVDVTALDPVDDVVAWYEDELAGEGWMTATASMPNGTGNVITGDKEGQSVIVTVLESDAGTDLSVQYTPTD